MPYISSTVKTGFALLTILFYPIMEKLMEFSQKTTGRNALDNLFETFKSELGHLFELFLSEYCGFFRGSEATI